MKTCTKCRQKFDPIFYETTCDNCYTLQINQREKRTNRAKKLHHKIRCARIKWLKTKKRR